MMSSVYKCCRLVRPQHEAVSKWFRATEQPRSIRYLGCNLPPRVVERFKNFVRRNHGDRDDPYGVRRKEAPGADPATKPIRKLWERVEAIDPLRITKPIGIKRRRVWIARRFV